MNRRRTSARDRLSFALDQWHHRALLDHPQTGPLLQELEQLEYRIRHELNELERASLLISVENFRESLLPGNQSYH